MIKSRWNIHPSRATTRQNFRSALARHVPERRNPAVGESDQLARIRNALREPGISKRIIQRRTEIDVPRGVIRIVWVTSIISINPGFRPSATHVANDFSIRRPPRQPYCRSWHADANLPLTYQRLV